MRCEMTSNVEECALRARSTHGVHHATVEVNIVIGVVLGEVLVAQIVPLVVDAVICLTLGLIAHVIIVVFVVAFLLEFSWLGDILFTKSAVVVGLHHNFFESPPLKMTESLAEGPDWYLRSWFLSGLSFFSTVDVWSGSSIDEFH